MNISKMQRKLSQWAEENKEHRFFDLYHLLYDKEWLQLAHDHVKANSGSVTAGCDGINMEKFDQELELNLQKLMEELKLGKFMPKPTRRVNILKPNGKKRPLGISTIKDRIVQEALRMILEPIYEADFSQYSFGFRPNRSTMDAIKCITWSVQEHKKYFWIVEGDISSYFDSINHRKLVKLLKRRIKDRKLLSLIWKFLKAGIMENKKFRDTKLGVPQGGIVSPLLSNIYLHELDKYMQRYTELSKKEKTARRRAGLSNFVYVRYADDFLVLCNGTKAQAEQMKEELFNFLSKELRLTLSKEKTKITHLNDGFEFLGFKIHRGMSSKGIKTKVEIPKKSIQKVRNKIRIITDKSTHQNSASAKILALNRVYGGWCRYYQYTSKAATIFNKVNHFMFKQLAHWLARKYKMSMPKVMRRFRNGNSLAAGNYNLIKPLKTQQYKKAFLKPNPYRENKGIKREELLKESYWTGHESRPGMMDLRIFVLERDKYICQTCGITVTANNSHIDHKRQYIKYKLPENANALDNLQTLCIACHKRKTKSDRQMESRMQ